MAIGRCRGTIAVAVVAAALGVGLVRYLRLPVEPPLQLPEVGYWGAKRVDAGAEPPPDDETIYKFTIAYDDAMVGQLKADLERTRWAEPLEEAASEYGINLNSFRTVIEYWRTKFDFKRAERELNAFPHYRTEIEGLKVHFFRSAPARSHDPAKVKVLPLLMVHGWPGSVVEFLKVASLLSQPVNNTAFDIIVPSIPGYGFSEAPSKQGVNVLVTARIFRKLMTRLGYSKFYMQGGDWGSAVTSAMSVLYPDRLRGIHVNTLFPSTLNAIVMAKMFLFTMLPGTFGDGQLPPCMPVPFGERFAAFVRETGYLHIQGTKPDTIGFGLLNSPAGLAAYIIEKFSTWTRMDFQQLDDGGLTQKFSLHDLISNVMVYYASGSIVSSQRYYKENLAGNVPGQIYSRASVVPMGYAVFPHEIICAPRFLVAEMYRNVTTMSYLDDGGHFAAFERPDLLADDVRRFVHQVELLYPETLHPPKGFRAVESR